MTKKRTGERGSIEIVVLVIAFAAVIGLIVWRYAEADKAQTEAENAIANDSVADQVVMDERVEVPEMAVSFETPTRENVSYEMVDDTTASLRAERLTAAEYTCEGENVGEFATLHQGVGESDAETAFTGEAGGERYAVMMPEQACYSDELMTEYEEVASQAARTLRVLEAEE